MSLSSAERLRFVGLLQQMETSIGASSIAQFVQDHNLNWDHLQSRHKRLASFLRILDSNQVGERQNAGRLAAKYIKQFGLTYDDVIGADLPPEATWTDEPEAEWEPFEGEPLAFLLQVNLAEVAPFDVEGQLPASGLLHFFCLDTLHRFGREPDEEELRVLYTPGDRARLRRVPPPHNLRQRP